MMALYALTAGAQQPTYAEKLGWPKGARVIVLHVDDGHGDRARGAEHECCVLECLLRVPRGRFDDAVLDGFTNW